MLMTIKDLHVSYGHIVALRGVTLDIEEGQIISIIGSNGAGKSTLLNAISGVVKPKQGEILFNNEKLPNSPHKIVQKGITHVPEGRKVFAGLSVEENLQMGGVTQPIHTIKPRIEEMYKLFTRLGERKEQQAGTLSGGEQQMVAIARGLMANPKILLLDEPSLGLAPIVVAQVFKLIREIKEMGYTILLVEQNASQALKFSDYCYVLENGEIKMQGASEELRKSSDIISAYLGEKA